MRTAMLILLCLASTAQAKDTPLTGAWSGIWADPSGQYTCAVQVQSAADPTRLVLLCQLGANGGGFANVAPIPESGTEIWLTQPVAPFGGVPAGSTPWGRIAVFGICATNGTQPLLHIGALGPAGASAVTELYPVQLAGRPCITTGARQ